MYANDQFKPLSKRSLLTIMFNCYQKLGVGAPIWRGDIGFYIEPDRLPLFYDAIKYCV